MKLHRIIASIKGKRTSHRALFGGGEIAALLQGKDRRALESWRAPEECTKETWNADADPSLTKSKGCPCCFNILYQEEFVPTRKHEWRARRVFTHFPAILV